MATAARGAAIAGSDSRASSYRPQMIPAGLRHAAWRTKPHATLAVSQAAQQSCIVALPRLSSAVSQSPARLDTVRLHTLPQRQDVLRPQANTNIERPTAARTNPAAPPPRIQRRLPSPWLLHSGAATAPLPLHAYRLHPRPHAVTLDAAIAGGASPFELVQKYTHEHIQTRLSPSAISAWNVYCALCLRFNKTPLPLTAEGLVGFMIGYVRVKGNSSASLPSEMSHLSAYTRAQRPQIAWPDFVAETGEQLSKHIHRIQTDWPAEICPAPELTYETGLARAVAYLDGLKTNLWTLQWAAILSLSHALLLRPSDIIPLDDRPVAEGTTSAFMYPRRGDFTFVEPDQASPDGELHYYNPLHKMGKHFVERRTCMPATAGLGNGAVVDARRSLHRYLDAAGYLNSPPHTPVFHYRHRDGSPRGHMSRAVILREFRSHILAPAGVPDWELMQLRSLRPGGTTDLRSAGVPTSVVHKIGKWKKEEGSMTLYDRSSRYLLKSVAPFCETLREMQRKL